MREIKFRAWDTEDKIMWQPLTLDELIEGEWELRSTDHEFSLPNKDYLMFSHKNTIWMQYTGFKDNNGVEIFEGDIVKADEEYAAGEKVGPVVWLSGYGIWYVESNVDDALGEVRAFGVEYLGNIYENPELLNQ